MPITTSPSVSYVARTAFMVVLCVGFAAWGAYDLWVKIPRNEEAVRRYEAANSTLKRLDEARQAGAQPTQQDIDEYTRAKEELRLLTPGGTAPVPPGEWDRPTQWIFIACLPFAVWPFVQLMRVRRQKYTLDEAGTLHFAGDASLGSGAWPAADVRDMDMSRWMRKSIATAVHADGQRLKLDAYLHKNLDMIVGVLASRARPTEWTPDAKPVKSDAESGGPAGPASPEA